MFDLPTHPDGNFYSIPETNEMFRHVMDDVEKLDAAVDTIIGDNYKIGTMELEADTDLNDVLDSGTYLATSTAIASSLKNKPTGVTAAVAIVVYRFGTNTLIQVIYSATKIYCRRKTTTGFGSWYEYTGVQESQ